LKVIDLALSAAQEKASFMGKTIALIGTLDTKGKEYAFVKRLIEERGHRALLIDIGVLGAPFLPPDVSSREVARAGGEEIESLARARDRGRAMEAMSRGAASLLVKLHAEGKFDGVLALGGGGGTSVATAAMRALPLGVPKVMVSTIAGKDVTAFVGTSDIVMVPSLVDISGLNRISRGIFSRAAGAVCGMAEAEAAAGEDRPVIAATMFGNTTPAVRAASEILDSAGYDVVVFPCSGTSGRVMEALIDEGRFSGVLDVTTTEWADELVGGVLAAGPGRLDGAAKKGVPQVVAPGCLDMVNFWAPETVPERFRGRLFYRHNPNVTLMRTTPEENAELGRIIARKLNRSEGRVWVFIPLKGVSMLDSPGGPFWWPDADRALFESLKRTLRADIPVTEMECNINDEAFAEACANSLIELLDTEEGR